MSRAKSWIAIVALLILAAALVAVVEPERADAASLSAKLRAAKVALRESRERLEAAEAALAAALAEDGALTAADDSPTVEELQARIDKIRKSVRRWTLEVRRIAEKLELQRKLAAWERKGDWMPIIKIAAAKYHVKAAGVYRIMMRESGGNRRAGSNTAFKGLFQYWTGTWSSSWNPWRRDSIYDGSSQIYATCYAIHRGMGPQMWTTTFASQY